MQTVFEIKNNNIEKLNFFNFIKPKAGAEIDLLGFPLEQTDPYPEGETDDLSTIENFEYKKKIYTKFIKRIK